MNLTFHALNNICHNFYLTDKKQYIRSVDLKIQNKTHAQNEKQTNCRLKFIPTSRISDDENFVNVHSSAITNSAGRKVLSLFVQDFW